MTVTIYPTTEDFVQLRFAFSPMWEVAASFRVLQNPARHALYLRWVNETLPLIQQIDVSYIAALVTPEGYIPDFLTPTPFTPRPSIEEEFAYLAATATIQIKYEVTSLNKVQQQTTPIRQQFLDQPRESLQILVQQLQNYWSTALAGQWTRMVNVLEGDVLYRARQMALHGAECLFSDLHPTLHYDGERIEIGKRFTASVNLDGRGMLLVPSIFTWPDLYVQLVPSWRPMILYNARGAGIWRHQGIEPNIALQKLIGKGKAQILQHLATPISNSDLSEQIGISAGAVSQHINGLKAAGLVDSTQQGKWVYYRLTERGEALLALFDN